jgi:hypothetical protein
MTTGGRLIGWSRCGPLSVLLHASRDPVRESRAPEIASCAIRSALAGDGPRARLATTRREEARRSRLCAAARPRSRVRPNRRARLDRSRRGRAASEAGGSRFARRCRSRRKDGPTSYHLAVTVDDAIQGVTLVTRGEDLATATHVHRVLQALLGLPTPRYRHHEFVTDAAGRRLSKRDRALTIRSMRRSGISPAKIIARAASMGEGRPLRRREFETASIERAVKTGRDIQVFRVVRS